SSFLLLSFSIILPYLIVDLKLCNRTDKPMAKQVEKAIYQYDWDRIETLCATIESRLIDLPEVIIEDRLEQIRKLKNYLSRNWVYIKPFKKRELSIDRGTGAGETGHRLYTYRMKRQGRSWTKKGASHVVAILTAEKTGLLQTALTAEITDKVESLGEEIKGAVRQALKKIDSTAKQSKRVLSSIMVRKAAL
ncbi:UPF0236 family protein, partial [Enterococcus faecium]|nr:UPF0236 family protein [Enterococcus faecium]